MVQLQNRGFCFLAAFISLLFYHNEVCIFYYLIKQVFCRWEESSCAMESLYDIDQISRTVPVILDNSKKWDDIVSRSMKLEVGGVAHVQGISRGELKQNPLYSTALVINRTASPLAW